MQNNHSYLKKETRQQSFICKIAFIYNSEFFDIYQVFTKTELNQSSLKENWQFLSSYNTDLSVIFEKANCTVVFSYFHLFECNSFYFNNKKQ